MVGSGKIWFEADEVIETFFNLTHFILQMATIKEAMAFEKYPEEYKQYLKEELELVKEFVKGGDVYLTVDMDVFDPSIAPGVSTPEPDGIKYHDFVEKLKVICEFANIVGMDVVETRPLGENKITEILAAKLIFKILNHEFIQ